MSKKEKIVCAAVRFVRALERTGRESNIDVLCIRYDDECVNDLREKLKGSLHSYTEREVLEFKTNRNRFVDPREAMKIALKANQISSVEEVARMVAHHKTRAGESALTNMVELYLAKELKPEDLY